MAENVNFASVCFPFLRSQLFKTFLLWFLYKAFSQLLFICPIAFILFSKQGSPENKILYHSSRKKNQYISNSLSGSNKMIYVFLLYPLLDYEFLIGKDSDSLSLIVQGTEIESAVSYISYFLFLSKKNVCTISELLIPLPYISLPTTFWIASIILPCG